MAKLGRKPLVHNSGTCVSGRPGCNRKARCRGMCDRCYGNERYHAVERVRRGAQTQFRRTVGDVVIHKTSGYAHEYVGLDVPGAQRGFVKQHRKVMTEMLGRPLRPKENVHHKNAIKHDNRPANLELWVSAQPKGARVVDLVEYAHWILQRYETEVDLMR